MQTTQYVYRFVCITNKLFAFSNGGNDTCNAANERTDI